MTRAELISKLLEKFPQLTHPDVNLSVKAILDAMASHLGRHERIEIRGFGSFKVNVRPPRIGRNPKTGVKVEIPAKPAPHFKPGVEMRERVDFYPGSSQKP